MKKQNIMILIAALSAAATLATESKHMLANELRGKPMAYESADKADIMSLTNNTGQILAFLDAAHWDVWKKAIEIYARNTSAKTTEILQKHYAALPDGESSTTTQQPQKRILLPILSDRLKGSEKEAFLMSVLRKEVKLIREAEYMESAMMYPYDILQSALKLAGKGGVANTNFAEIKRWADDPTLGVHARPYLMSAYLRHDLFAARKLSQKHAATELIALLPAQPKTSTPRDIYDDVEKRRAYGKRPDVMARRDEFGKWVRSDAGTLYKACKLVLHEIGPLAAMEIANHITQSQAKEKNFDSLAVIAAEILANDSRTNRVPNAATADAVGKLAEYESTITEDGVFSHKDYLQGYIKACRMNTNWEETPEVIRNRPGEAEGRNRK